MIEEIKELIRKAVGTEIDFSVFFSERPEFGHYSTNVGFFVDKDSNKLAEEILSLSKDDKRFQDFFQKVEVRGKFINFWIAPEALAAELQNILKYKDNLLTSSGIKKLKVNLEFISANPTGPLTMANGRGGFLGDALANVLETVGHKVAREYYINDAGNQIRLLGESVLAALGKMPEKEEHYRGEYIKKLAGKLKNKISGHPMSKNYVHIGTSDISAEGGSSTGGQNIEAIGRLAAAELLKQIKKSVKDVGIEFDEWYSEFKKLRGKKGLVKKVLAMLEENGLVEKKEGALWLRTSDIADPDASVGAGEKDRVLVKSDGQPTYFLADLAYHYDKFVLRKFDKAIDIWGADHHGYVARLKSGVKALRIDPEQLKIIIVQLVRLVEGGKEVRMSKRKGEFVTLDELVEVVGNKDAVRFFFLLYSPDTHMDFDLALAKERSQKNPVYYTQYAYVRALHILEKSKIKNQKSKLQIKIQKINKESDTNLLNELVKLPHMIQQTAEDFQVNRLARYAMDLARAFHNFYDKERVIKDDGGVDEAKLALVAASKIIFERLFKILGIAAPEKM